MYVDIAAMVQKVKGFLLAKSNASYTPQHSARQPARRPDRHSHRPAPEVIPSPNNQVDAALSHTSSFTPPQPTEEGMEHSHIRRRR
jgi:hypothetical protein